MFETEYEFILETVGFPESFFYLCQNFDFLVNVRFQNFVSSIFFKLRKILFLILLNVFLNLIISRSNLDENFFIGSPKNEFSFIGYNIASVCFWLILVGVAYQNWVFSDWVGIKISWYTKLPSFSILNYHIGNLKSDFWGIIVQSSYLSVLVKFINCWD